jgi:hypothetical protein
MSSPCITGLSQRVGSPGAQICGGLARARPDMGASGVEAWVVRVCRLFLGLNCAAGELSVRSGSGKNGCARIAKRGKRASQASRVPDEERKWGLAAGDNTPLRRMTERGRVRLFQGALLPESGCFADEPGQGALVGHKVTLQESHVARG